MSERSTEHATFVVERVYDASPDRAFAAWADPQAKARWYNGSQGDYELDFSTATRQRRGASTAWAACSTRSDGGSRAAGPTPSGDAGADRVGRKV